MKLHLGYLGFDYGHLDDLLPELAYREEIDISSELVPPGRILDDHFFEELISNDLNDDIHEYVYQTYEDIMNNVIAEVTLAPKAQYNLQEVLDIITKEATSQILDETKNTHMLCVVTDDEKELYRSEYDLHAFLEYWVRNREETEQGNIDAGRAMIEGTEQFIDDGLWQYSWIQVGEKKKALMWFGLKGEKPEEGWILNIEPDSNTGKTWQDYWFNNEWENRVPDDDGMLDYWMGMECGDYLPPMEEVLETCPIEVSHQDDYDSLTGKIICLLESIDEQ